MREGASECQTARLLDPKMQPPNKARSVAKYSKIQSKESPFSALTGTPRSAGRKEPAGLTHHSSNLNGKNEKRRKKSTDLEIKRKALTERKGIIKCAKW